MRPQVSVVVPTFRRPALLQRCLDALLHQDFAPGRYEIIIVDDGATEDTRAMVEGWQQCTARQHGPLITYLAVTGNHGPAAARNLGWRHAQGEIIAFTDDDCVPTPTWLRTGVRAFRADVACITGRIRMPIPAVPTDYERNEAGLERAELVTANCFCRRSALQQVGGFDERFRMAWREDSDLQFQLLRHQLPILAEPAAVVVHPVRPAPWGVSISQQKKVQYDALLYKKHPVLYRQRIRPAPPWRYYVIVAALLLGAAAACGGHFWAAGLAWGTWLLLTARFCLLRLNGTSHQATHVAEMIVTSVAIPPVSLFWRWAGQLRFGVPFF